MQYVRVVKKSYHLKYRVGLADVREELISQPFARRGALHESGDVNEFYRRRNYLG